MANTGFVEFASVSQSAGGGSITWTNLTNMLSGAGTYASQSLDDSETGYVASVVNASSPLTSAIPSGATIDGIVIRIEATTYDGGTAEAGDILARMIVNGSQNGTDKSIDTEFGDSSIVARDYGGATDKWGITSGGGAGGAPVRDDVIATNFGVAIQFYGFGASPSEVRIYRVLIDVYYTAAGGSTEEADGAATTGAATAEGLAARLFEAVGEAFLRVPRPHSIVNVPTKTAYGEAAIKKPIAEGNVTRVVVVTGDAAIPATLANTLTEAVGAATTEPAVGSGEVYKTTTADAQLVLGRVESSGIALRGSISDYLLTLGATEAKGYLRFKLNGSIDVELPSIEFDIGFSVTRGSSGDVSLPAVTASGVASSSSESAWTASSGVTLEPVTAEGIGLISRFADGESILPATLIEAVIEVVSNTHTVSCTILLPALFVESEASVVALQLVDADGAGSLPVFEASGIATNAAATVHTADGSVVTGSMTVSGNAVRYTDITGDATIPATTSASTGYEDIAGDGEAVGTAYLGVTTTYGTSSRTIKATGAADIPVIQTYMGAWKFTASGSVVLPSAEAAGNNFVVRKAEGSLLIPSTEIVGEGEARGPSEAYSPVRIEIPVPVISGTAKKITKASGHPEVALVVFDYSGMVARSFSLEMEIPAIEAYAIADASVNESTQMYVVTRVERIRGTNKKVVHLEALHSPVMR